MRREQMNGTLFDGFDEYSQEEDNFKSAAQPVRNQKYPYPQKYTNPPDSFDETQDTSRQDQTETLNKTQNDQKIRKQRAQLLRERAGLLTDEPPRKLKKSHKKWGNFLVIYDGKMPITLGPDYWCFLPTFICFTLMSVAIMYLVFSNSSSIVVKLSGILICGGELLSYLLMATSDPGIALEEDDDINLDEYENPQKSQPMKMCAKCGFSVPRSSYHCNDCDVCILGYDHHCPWTSKCIGKNNLCRFYTFLAFTPIFLVYNAVAFVVTMSQTASITRVHHITKLLLEN